MKNIEKYIFPIVLLIGGVVLLVVGLENHLYKETPSTIIMIIGIVLIIIGIVSYCYNFKEKMGTDKWLKKAAEAGDAEAQYHFGICYEQGHGVTKDISMAVKWYRKAADQNLEEAKIALQLLGFKE